MFTVFDMLHLRFAQNLLCSQLSIDYDFSRHLYIALDEFAYEKLIELKTPDDYTDRPRLILLNVRDRGYQWKQFCMLKLVIQYQLLTMNVDTTICDDDVVFYKDPFDLFDPDTDFQVESEGGDREFSEKFEYDKLNSGFFRVVPSELVVRFYNFWARIAIHNQTHLDQYILGEMIEPLRDKRYSGVARQYYDISKFPTFAGETLRMTWFDPMLVPTARLFHWERDATLEEARKRGIRRPYVFHGAYLRREQKTMAFAQNDLWLVWMNNCDAKKTLRDPWPGPGEPPPKMKYSF